MISNADAIIGITRHAREKTTIQCQYRRILGYHQYKTTIISECRRGKKIRKGNRQCQCRDSWQARLSLCFMFDLGAISLPSGWIAITPGTCRESTQIKIYAILILWQSEHYPSPSGKPLNNDHHGTRNKIACAFPDESGFCTDRL